MSQDGGGGSPAHYKVLKDKFDYQKNPHYRKLHSRHSKAQNRARKNLTLEDTTGLSEEEIVKNIAEYMKHYDLEAGLRTDKLEDWQEKAYEGKARELLEEVAKNQETDIKTLMTRLHEEGVESIFQKYATGKREEDRGRLHRAHMYDVVSPLSYEERLALATELKKKEPTAFEDIEPGEIVPGLENVLLRHFGDYHQRTVGKSKKEKGKKKRAAEPHHMPRAA